jgi:LacI family transcriptional regulator
METAGIDIAPGTTAQGNYTFASGHAAAQRLLEARPTAIFASNDEMAAGVLHAARERGMEVPHDLSILGFDDTAIAAHIWPPLTTVRWPIVSMARAAARKLIHPETAEREPALFRSELIRRASVAPGRE